MFGTKVRKFQEFVELITKLEPVEYCGLCKVMCVNMIGENGEPLPFDETLEAVLDKFLKLKKKPKNEILEMLRAIAAEGDEDGAISEN